MLVQYKVKNYMSYLNEACLDMRATRIKEHEYALLKVDNSENDILPVAAIYGANASGKSNLISSISSLAMVVTKSIDVDNNEDDLSILPIIPFTLQKSWRNTITEYAIDFIVDNIEYLLEINLNFDTIFHESVKARNYCRGSFVNIYSRGSNEKLTIGKNKIVDLLSLDKEKICFFDSMLTKKTDLLLTSLGRRNIVPFNEIYKWFGNINVAATNESIKDSFICKEGSNVKKLFDNANERKQYLKFIQKADPAICEIGIKPAKEEGEYLAYYKHKIIDSDKTEEMLISLESRGTRKLFDMYPGIRRVLRNGGILLADELGAELHPYLLLHIISLFQNKKTNPNKAQLLFCLHNPVVLSNRYLRRDEIWFVEKDTEGRSELYSLADFKDEDGDKIRKDADFGKWYLLGCFGGIPDTSNWGDLES